MTRRAHRGTAIAGTLFAVWVVYQSIQLQFFTKLGPGPGFFPLILGAAFGALSLVWLAQTSLGKRDDGEPRPALDRGAVGRVALVLASLIGVVLLIEPLGYQIAMSLFLFSLTKFLGRQKILAALIVALAGGVGLFHLFGKVLDLALPTSAIPALAAIGL